ncbi:MAG: hypothetical protein KAT43_05455 [Nanoarchaeota archaeon]|nr:hypothetical protein [Nanoarchaeota archaeon]
MTDKHGTESFVLDEVTRDLDELAIEEGIVERATEIANDPANSPEKPTAGKAGVVLRVLRYDIAPEEEIAAIKARIESNTNLYDDFSGLVSKRGIEFSLYNANLVAQSAKERAISSDEWQALLQFRQWPDFDTDGSTKRIDYFRKCLELADKFIDGSPDFGNEILAKPALEVYATLGRMRLEEANDSELNTVFTYRMFNLGLQIYHTLVRHKEECQDLTLWQYDALIDSALQYAMDIAEELSAAEDSGFSVVKKYDTLDEVRASLAKLEKRERSTGSV